MGFIHGCSVAKVLNGQDVLINYNYVPYLLSMESTVGLWNGHQLKPTPVFVNGTVTANALDGNTTTVTQLQSVQKQQLQRVIQQSKKKNPANEAADVPSNKESKSGSSNTRVWRDKSGKFSIEARLLEINKTEVVLVRTDGKITRVPRDKLCDEDQKYLSEQDKE